MASIAGAARTVAWIADEAWGRVGRATGGTPHEVAPGVVLLDGEIELADDADPAVDPTYVLRVATAAARHEARIGRRSLDRLAETVPQWPERWPAGAVDKLVGLLLEGHAAIPVMEALDQRGLITRMLPEWEPVRSRPQRNAYHRYTVDRHLWETAANAAELVDTVARPDLLVLGALFHDIGKGYPGDHTDAGDRARARDRTAHRRAAARRRGARGDGAIPPAAARRRRAPRPRRPGDDPARRRRGRRPGSARPAARADDRRLQGHRPVGVGRAGRRSSSPTSWPA